MSYIKKGTSFSKFIPANEWEAYFQSKLLTDYIDDQSSDFPIENIYSTIFNSTDTDEAKIKQFKFINEHVTALVSLYDEIPESLILFKNDIQTVFVYKTFAVKIFRLDLILKNKLNQLFELLLKNECPNLEYIYRAYAVPEFNFYVVVSKVVDTINFKKTFSKNLVQCRENIHRGIDYLYSHGWIHRDVSIGNSGFDEKSNNYLLFDFNLSKFEDNVSELERLCSTDKYDLEKSIKYNIEVGICL